LKVISAIVGIVLLLAALVLSYLSSNGEVMLAKQDAKIMEYVVKSQEALKDEDVMEALKYAKLAIIVDPTNRKGFKAYEAAVELKYKPTEDLMQKSEEQMKPEVEEEIAPDMGC